MPNSHRMNMSVKDPYKKNADVSGSMIDQMQNVSIDGAPHKDGLSHGRISFEVYE